MSLFKEFQQYGLKEKLFTLKDRLLIAVSGGVDSIVLCELCRQAGYDFAIAHCNFKLRDAESDEDEKFVKQLAANYKVEFFVKEFDTQKYISDNKCSTQVAARDLRYQWFAELLKQEILKPFSYLLTAHHADDNVETILMNFFKGTGIQGLKGILPKQEKIVRPLLFATKEMILDFASKHKLVYREDSSNRSDKYTRNYFRNQLIPDVQKIFPSVKENLIHNSGRFRDIYILYTQSVDAVLKKLVFIKGDEMHIPVLKLEKTTSLHTIIYEIIKDFGFSPQQVSEVIKLLNAESGKYIQSGTHRILKNRAWLIISALGNISAQHYLVEENDKEILMGSGKMVIEKNKKENKISPGINIATLDASMVKFPLIIRKWKQGDYFYPLGMQKKKKLSRFFIDQKLSLMEKENTWIIESNKKIIWIIGKRIDDRFKITDKTKYLLNIYWLPSQ